MSKHPAERISRARPVSWAAVGITGVLSILALYLPYQFQAFPHRFVYPYLRPFGALLAACSLAGAVTLLSERPVRWLSAATRTLMVFTLLGWGYEVAVRPGLITGLSVYGLLCAAVAAAGISPGREEDLMAALSAGLLLSLSGILLGSPAVVPPPLLRFWPVPVKVAVGAVGALQILSRWPRMRQAEGAVWLLAAASYGWLAVTWFSVNNWHAGGFNGSMAAAAALWAVYRRRPWRFPLTGLTRRLLLLFIVLTVLPISTLGAGLAWVVQVRAQSQTRFRMAEIAGRIDHLLDERLAVGDHPNLQAAAGLAQGPAAEGGFDLQVTALGSLPERWPDVALGFLEEQPPQTPRQLVFQIRRPDLGLGIVLTRPAPSVYGGAARTSLLILTGVLGLVCLAAAFSLLTARKLTRHLLEIRDLASFIGERRFNVRLALDGGWSPELAELGASFNWMAATLQAYDQTIAEQRQELEERARRQEALAALSRSAFTVRSALPVMEQAADLVARVLNGPVGVLMLGPDGSDFRLRAAAGVSDLGPACGEEPLNDPALAALFESIGPVVLPTDVVGGDLRPLAGPHRNILFQPIRLGNRTLGAVAAGLPNVPGPVQETVGFLSGVAGVISTAVEREETARRQAAEHGVARVLAEAGEPAETVPALLKAICEPLGWQLGLLWLVAEGEPVLRCTEIYSGIDLGDAGASLTARVRSLALHPGEGLAGQAWASDVPLWFGNIARIEAFPLKADALSAGLMSALCVPVRVGPSTMGVISCFGREIRPMDRDLCDSMQAIGIQVGQYLQRKRLEDVREMLYREVNATLRRLQESHAMLNTLIDCAPVGIGFLDTEFRYVRVNEALGRLNGATAAGHVGRKVQEMFPTLAERMEPILRQLLATGTPLLNAEFSLPGPDPEGELKHWLVSLYPVRMPSGEPLGIGALTVEITQRKRMEDSLRASEQVLSGKREVLEQIATGAPLTDVLDTVARFTEQRVGGSCAILLLDETGSVLRTVAAPSLPEAVRQQIGVWPFRIRPGSSGAAVLQKQLIISCDIAADPFWESLWERAAEFGTRAAWSAPIFDPRGDVLGVITIYLQQTGEPRPEDLVWLDVACHMAAIAVSHQRWHERRAEKLASLIKHMAEGVIAVDQGGCLLFSNPAAARLLGIVPPPEQTPLSQIGLPQPLAEALAQAAAPGGEAPEQVAFAAGSVEVEAHVSPVFTDLGRYGAIAVMQDATARRQLQRLQESFVANVSHELRGPLASLSATLEAMADGLIPDAQRDRYLRAMLQEMDRLRRLSREVIDLTRLDSGTVDLQREPVVLDRVFDQCYSKSVQRCRSAGIRLVAAECGESVFGDADRVDQIITNLLDNAFRFTAPGGEVRVMARREGPMVRVLVKDTGEGIPAEHLPYIWERFYKADSARTLKPGSGTGLGLAIVRQLVERMGGEVAVESEPGTGTVFSFTLKAVE